MTPVQLDPDAPRCGSERVKMTRSETLTYVCEKPAGHVACGDTYHEGHADGGAERLGWPATTEERAKVA